jgi:DNA-binding NarL/FixJ family response regulator
MPHQSSIRILSVDNHALALALEGIAAMISMHRDMELVSHAQNGRGAVQSYRKHRPDVTLMDLQLPDMSGIDAWTLVRVLAEMTPVTSLGLGPKGFCNALQIRMAHSIRHQRRARR